MTDKSKPAGIGKASIIMASDDECMKYEEEIERILAAIGHPEALITDMSTFSHFIEYDPGSPTTPEEDQSTVDHWLKPLDLDGLCTPRTALWEAARLLRMRGCPH